MISWHSWLVQQQSKLSTGSAGCWWEPSESSCNTAWHKQVCRSPSLSPHPLLLSQLCILLLDYLQSNKAHIWSKLFLRLRHSQSPFLLPSASPVLQREEAATFFTSQQVQISQLSSPEPQELEVPPLCQQPVAWGVSAKSVSLKSWLKSLWSCQWVLRGRTGTQPPP